MDISPDHDYKHNNIGSLEPFNLINEQRLRRCAKTTNADNMQRAY